MGQGKGSTEDGFPRDIELVCVMFPPIDISLTWTRLKDCDVTWLYGPLQTDSKKPISGISPPPSRLSVSNSFLNKKPNLKKKSVSEAILQRSLSSHTLLQHAGAILKAQEAAHPRVRPPFGRAPSDFSMGSFAHSSTTETPTDESYVPGSAIPSSASSGLQSPGERRHIHFNDQVEQCIAVDAKDGDEDDEDDEPYNAIGEDEDESDDGLVMMKQVPSRARLSNRSTPRGSFSNDSKTIAPLPSTTLKYRGDTPEPVEPPKSGGFWGVASRLSSSSSQETLRPQNPSTNYLLDDDEEASDLDPQWKIPEKEGPSTKDSFASSSRLSNSSSDDEYDPGPGLRRTPSGMFMPYDDDEEENAMNLGLFGRVVDTVNTAKDIAHVIWNVGWRK